MKNVNVISLTKRKVKPLGKPLKYTLGSRIRHDTYILTLEVAILAELKASQKNKVSTNLRHDPSMAVTFQEAYRMQEDHDGKFLKKINLFCHLQHLQDNLVVQSSCSI